MVICLHVCMCIMGVPCADGGRGRALDSLELDVQTYGNRPVGAGTQTQVLPKSNECS